MSKKTTNYSLVKPELTDSADITATNSNWDTIDAELKQRATLGDDGKVLSSQLPSVNDQKVTFTRASVLQNLTSGSKLSTLFGQLDLLNYRYLNHVLLDNPHKVTASQVGAYSKIESNEKFAPAYTYGTEDIEEGSASPYENGHLHFIYEP